MPIPYRLQFDLMSHRILCLLLALCPALGAGEIVFNRDIRPILSDRCFHCHGPGTQRADLRLDTEEEASFVIEKGNPAESDATCDGIDDNCSGEPDEQYAVISECGTGVCRDNSTPSS